MVGNRTLSPFQPSLTLLLIDLINQKFNKKKTNK